MSQAFKLKYDRMKESSPAEPDAGDMQHDSQGHIRNICFVKADGYRIFLSYGYLITGEYYEQDNTITLSFTSHIITIKGLHLESLFILLQHHAVRQVVSTDQRYNLVQDEGSPVVNEIIIQKTNE